MRSTDGKSFLRERERNMFFYYDFELIFMGWAKMLVLLQLLL